MTYDYPAPLSERATEDERRLWESLWRLIEQLNLREDKEDKT